MSDNFYSGTEAELKQGAANCATLVVAGATTYGVPTATATAYQTLSTNYSSAYVTATTPATRTKLTIEAKNVLRKQLIKSSVALSKIISSNPSVTNEQLMALGFNPRRARTPVPPPVDQPTIKVLAVNGWTVTVSLAPQTPENVRGKPKGTQGISVFSHIGTAAPTDISDWVFEGNTGRTVMDISFSDTLAAGTQVWITAFYYNGRKQTGPSAVPVSTHILAGTVGNKKAA